jgi:hypothetical protein
LFFRILGRVQPGLIRSNVCLHRFNFWTIESTVAVHTNGFGSLFQAARNCSMAFCRSSTLAKTPHRREPVTICDCGEVFRHIPQLRQPSACDPMPVTEIACPCVVQGSCKLNRLWRISRSGTTRMPVKATIKTGRPSRVVSGDLRENRRGGACGRTEFLAQGGEINLTQR